VVVADKANSKGKRESELKGEERREGKGKKEGGKRWAFKINNVKERGLRTRTKQWNQGHKGRAQGAQARRTRVEMGVGR